MAAHITAIGGSKCVTVVQDTGIVKKNITSRIVSVCADDLDCHHLDSRQIPIRLEGNRYMVMEILAEFLPRKNDHSDSYRVDVINFTEAVRNLSPEKVKDTFSVSHKDVFSLLSQTITCVGCRKSVEGLFNNMLMHNCLALQPVLLLENNDIGMDDSYIKCPHLMHNLLYKQRNEVKLMIDAIPKNRRNRRCPLHSLDGHKCRSSGIWVDVWDLLSQQCRHEIVTIDSKLLMATIDNYLRKHKFCTDCKTKVLRAYSLLIGELDCINEKEYRQDLYEGITCCNHHCQFISVQSDTDFVAHLIDRAEPEITGSRREHHAKSMEAAQEEILTCIGIHLWEKLHKLWQKLRAEEQTWLMLFYLSIEALRRKSEIVLQGREGEPRLEKILQEISEVGKAKELKREQKRLKRKKRKMKEIVGAPNCSKVDCQNSTINSIPDDDEETYLENGDNCNCPDVDEQNDADTGSNSSDTLHDNNFEKENIEDDSCHSCVNGGDYHLEANQESEQRLKYTDPSIPDEEIKLLHSMGWLEFVEDPFQDYQSESSGISEKDIKDYEANKTVIRIRRDELREKLLHQFQSISYTK